MKNKKAKLYYSVVALALAMSFFLVGVYSAANRQAAVTGSLSFTSDFVLVRYNVDISNPYNGDNPTTYQSGNYAKSGAFTESDQASKTEEFGEDILNIQDGSRRIALRVTFQPPSGVSAFYKNFKITVTNETENTPSWLTIKVGTTASGSTTLATGATRVYDVTTAQSSSVVFVVFEAPAQHNITTVEEWDFELTFDLTLNHD